MRTPITDTVLRIINDPLDKIEAKIPRFLWLILACLILVPGCLTILLCIVLDKLFSQKN